MSDKYLHVLLAGEVIGRLHRRDDAQDPDFVYTAAYARNGTVSLSARLPLTTAEYPAKRVMPFLLGLLPESEDARRRWATQFGVDARDTFGLLAHMGWDCPGAVQFCSEADLPMLQQRTPELAEVTDAQIAQRLRLLRSEPAGWTMPEEHWSLAGQQEKFALVWADGRWHEARGAAATTHIVKPGIRHLHAQALVEHATMRAAALLGVDVAGTQLLQFEDEWALVVDRFDRRIASDGSIARLHQEDFCQALGRLPSDKYEQRGGPTLAQMSKLVAQQSVDALSDARALADFAMVNVVAGAPDGHAKNISLLRTSSGNWVGPLYDLASGLVYDSSVVDRAVAISVGGERLTSRMYQRQWMKLADQLGIEAGSLLNRLHGLAVGFPDAFVSAVSDLHTMPEANAVLERARSALEQHCKRIIEQLDQ